MLDHEFASLRDLLGPARRRQAVLRVRRHRGDGGHKNPGRAAAGSASVPGPSHDEPSEVVVHAHLLDPPRRSQEALGVLGVN